MFLAFSDNFQLGVDCAAALGADRQVVFGWHMAPRGVPVELGFTTADGRICRVEYISRHLRPDVVPQDPGAAVVVGFSLVLSVPPRSRGLLMTVGCGEQSGRANLTDPAIKTDLFRATLDRDWSVTFGLLAECRDHPDHLPLLTYQYRPFGIFASWVAQLPLIQGQNRDIGPVTEIIASSSPAGEVFIDLRFIGRSAATPVVQVVAAARLRSTDGGPDDVRLLPLVDCSLLHLPGSSAFYGRLEWEQVDRLRNLDVLVQINFDAERVWLRCQPRQDSVPAFLDAVGAAPAGRLRQSLLRDVMARRQEFFLTQPPAGFPVGEDAPPVEPALPALAIIGVDDAAAVRLIHLVAAELEAAAASLIFAGVAAEAAAQIFVRRGRIPVEIVLEIEALFDNAALATPGKLAILFPAGLARAVISRDVKLLVRRSCEAGLNRLMGLHRLAGPTKSLGDSLARQMELMESPHSAWDPVDHPWSSMLGAELVNEHLETIWRSAPEPRP